MFSIPYLIGRLFGQGVDEVGSAEWTDRVGEALFVGQELLGPDGWLTDISWY